MNTGVPLFLLTGALALTLQAQELVPELAPLAAKYKTDTAALETQKTAEMARLAQVYGTSLDSAEKMETTAGHVTGIAAIAQERSDLQKNEIKDELSGTLPKTLHTARKTYLDGLERVTADFGQRQQRINADYLRNLATLQSRLSNNPAVAVQIAAEKERVLKAAPIGTADDISRLFADSNWRNVGGAGGIALHADGSVTSTWGGAGKWKVLSLTRFEMRWDNAKPQVWTIDRAARILGLDGGKSRWERQ